MVVATKISSKRGIIQLGKTVLTSSESLLFAEKLKDFADDLEDKARIADNKGKDSSYTDADTLDALYNNA